LQIALLISILAAVFSIAKAWQMIFQLKVVCLVCLLMYFANVFIALLLIGLSGLKHKLKFTNYTAVHQQTEKKQSIHNLLAYSPGLFSAIVVFFMAYLVMNFSFPDVARNRIKSTHKQSISNDTIPDNMLANHFAQTKRDIKLVADVPMWGNARAGITVVEFSDFQCPFCQIAAGHLKDLLSEFKNQIKLYFIHYPLDKSVNPHITTSGHKYAGLAARAAIYAFDKGQFWQFHDDLFQRQTELNKETVFSIARNYGWNITQFETAVKSIDMINRLKKHIKCGQDTEIQGTPTLYINGRLVEQWQNVSVLRAIIQHEMQLNKGI
jgi:protein-disulfide isomerase